MVRVAFLIVAPLALFCCIHAQADDGVVDTATCSGEADPSQSSAVDRDLVDMDQDSPRSLWDFMRVFRSLGTSWSHVFGQYTDVVKTAHGTTMKGDIYADDLSEGIKLLQNIIGQAITDAAVVQPPETGDKWDFRAVPFDEFEVTLDDLLVAFLKWSAVDISEEEDGFCHLRGGVNRKGIIPINVSNAFRRLEAYATWMDEEGADLMDPPLTLESISKSRDLLYSRITHDECGRTIWWLDLSQTNFEGMKELPQKEILRFFVWIAHIIMFDEQAQDSGILFVDNMAQVSFFQYMTMLPVQLGMAVDKFMIGVIPLKTKLVVFMDRPLWFDAAFGLIRFILPKNMKDRVALPEGDQRSMEEIVGISKFPEGFGNFQGSLAEDLIAAREMAATA